MPKQKRNKRRERIAAQALQLLADPTIAEHIAGLDEAHLALVRGRAAEYVDGRRSLGDSDAMVVADEDQMDYACCLLRLEEADSINELMAADYPAERRDAIALIVDRWRTDFGAFRTAIVDYISRSRIRTPVN